MIKSYKKTATLTGIDASLSATISIAAQHLAELKSFQSEGGGGDDYPEIPVLVELKYFSKEESISRQYYSTVWSDSIFDLLDLSVCISHLADKNDTTEKLAAGGSRKKYFHRAQWELVQSLFDWKISDSSKLTKKFKGIRYISIWFETDASNPNQYTLLQLESLSAPTKQFAKELRQIYEDIEKIN